MVQVHLNKKCLIQMFVKICVKYLITLAETQTTCDREIREIH